jgi:4-oxalocrotonate tautomerase
LPIVEISLFAGRTPEAKLRTARAISDALVEHAGATPESVQVIFRDVERSDWLQHRDLADAAD